VSRCHAPVLAVAFALLAGGASTAVAATPPAVKTGGAASVAPQSATIRGSINPHGAPTAYYFRFGTTKAYGRRTTTGDAGAHTRSVAVSAALTALRPKTTYHYQLVAFSTAGTTRGADRTFTTPQIPTTVALSAAPNPAAYGAAVSVAGSLSGPGLSGRQVALQGRPFPYVGAFQQIGSPVVTSPQGSYGFVVTAIITQQLRVVDLAKPSVMSPTVTQSIALATTLRVRRIHRSKRRFRFSGFVSPARIGNAVLIQRRTKRGWATVGLALTRADTAENSRFARKLRLRRGGRYRALARTIGGDYVDGGSVTVRVKLRRRHRG
jgi:hypothetical protein